MIDLNRVNILDLRYDLSRTMQWLARTRTGTASVTHPLLDTINRCSSTYIQAYVAICLPLDSSDLCHVSTASAAAASAACANEVDSGGRHSLLMATP